MGRHQKTCRHQPKVVTLPSAQIRPPATHARGATTRTLWQADGLVIEVLGVASKGDWAWLQCSLDCEKLVAYLLAVQILDDIIRQANLLELAEGVALHTEPSLSGLLIGT